MRLVSSQTATKALVLTALSIVVLTALCLGLMAAFYLSGGESAASATPDSAGPRMEKDCDTVVQGIQTSCNLWLMNPNFPGGVWPDGTFLPPADDKGCVHPSHGMGCHAFAQWLFNAQDNEGLGSWEEQIQFDSGLVQVAPAPDSTWLESGGRIANCSVTVINDGTVLTGCTTTDDPAVPGTEFGPNGDGLIQRILVVPKTSDLTSSGQLRPTRGNGITTDIVDEKCKVTDALGEQIPDTLPGGYTGTCGDAQVRLRILEGDLDLDCDVDLVDDQAIALRLGSVVGEPTYDVWYDIAPDTPDGHIDDLDLQFVSERAYSTCQHPIPPYQAWPGGTPAQGYDVSGAWKATANTTAGPDAGLTYNCDMNATQSGTQISGNMSCLYAGSGPISGVVNESTRQLTFTWTRPGLTTTVSAQLSGDGNSQNGTWWASNGDIGTYTASRAVTPTPTPTPTYTPSPTPTPTPGPADSDGDGIPDAQDACSDTPSSERPVDANGCSQRQVDQDLDGICDPGKASTLCRGSDACPDDPEDINPGSLYDNDGCPSWSFAVITDLHIGRYWEDSPEEYYLTQRLKDTLSWIKREADDRHIKFVVVLGDLSESGIWGELDKAKTILEDWERESIDPVTGKARLVYVPLIGNHDVGSGGRDSFSMVFSEQFKQLAEFFQDFVSQDLPQDNFLGFAFTYNDVIGPARFIALDFSGDGFAIASNAYMNELFVRTRLQVSPPAGAPVFVLAHHPLGTTCSGFLWPFSTASGVLDAIAEGTRGSTVITLGGHVHGYPPWSSWDKGTLKLLRSCLREPGAVFDANADETRPWNEVDIRSLTTEALMAGSNQLVGTPAKDKGFVRIVQVEGNQVLLDENNRLPPPVSPDNEPAFNPHIKKCSVEPGLGLVGKGFHPRRLTTISCEGEKYSNRTVSSWLWDLDGDGQADDATGQKTGTHSFIGWTGLPRKICLVVKGEGAHEEKICQMWK